ncbi:lipoate--protein ligase [Candidatus Uabimicrobium sp. HlEnr_7]|uniref:lipoate--protein ligase n=1 Tax=Candidatus Uabimicrobium helgolandensis TaxID=3095367 RepID=UPI003557F3E0
MDTTIVLGAGLDPWKNLAIEEHLLRNLRANECILYLWQNQNTVVIGKHQNAWRECQTKLLEEENGKLARRLSGGGAVFHDTGNLNFTFLVDRQFYNLEKQLQVILSAVQNVGISAKFSGRNDLVVEDKKFSGNAFYLRSKKAFHHGTIMVDADLGKLSRYLQVSKEKIESKGIKSVQARVANLTKYVPSLTIDTMKEALVDSFSQIYEGNSQNLDVNSLDQEKIAQLEEKYTSWEWRYGESPKFDITLDTRFPWGGVEIGLHLEHGKITQATIYSDAMDEEFIEDLPGVMEGVSFHSEKIADKVRDYGQKNGSVRESMVNDLASWLSTKGF